jgi:hypothetical protein
VARPDAVGAAVGLKCIRFCVLVRCSFQQGVPASWRSPFDLQWPALRAVLLLRPMLMFSPFDLQWLDVGLIRGPAFLIAVFAV